MKRALHYRMTLWLALIAVVALPLVLAAKKDKNSKAPGPDSVVVFIGNRMFPDFAEVVTTGLRERRAVGDSDYSFEVESFNPHFAIMDSTRQVVALSDEPKNPAFHIKVYKDDALVDSTWAFLNVDIPHFSRTSALWFRVLTFDYRGVIYKSKLPEGKPAANPHKQNPHGN